MLRNRLGWLDHGWCVANKARLEFLVEGQAAQLCCSSKASWAWPFRHWKTSDTIKVQYPEGNISVRTSCSKPRHLKFTQRWWDSKCSADPAISRLGHKTFRRRRPFQRFSRQDRGTARHKSVLRNAGPRHQVAIGCWICYVRPNDTTRLHADSQLTFCLPFL